MVELTDDFIDRQENRYYFKKNLLDVQKRKKFLIYSGVGRVGKTSLLKQFEKIIAGESSEKFVRYDFDSNENLGAVDMLTALKTLRASLTKKYRVEFPLFDKGYIFLAQKSGEFVSAEQQRTVMKSSAMLRGFKSHLNSLISKTDNAVITTKFVNSLFDSAGEFLNDLSDTSVMLKVGKHFVNFLDAQLAAREEKSRAAGDTNYGELLAELNKRNNDESAAPLRELLPRLFTKDLSFWLTANDTNLIIFLDAYEKLTGEEQGKKKFVRLISENRDVPVDWWVEELLTANRVRWIIAGRYKIEQIGELELEDGTVENHIVNVFDENWSKKYLEMNDVAEEDLRTAIIALTGGHPYYLRKCVETYKNYQLKGKVPRPADFGKNLDEIVEKTIGSLDENAQLMTQRLCILKSWTDEVAVNVIDNFNNVTYSRVKKMVARDEPLSFDDETSYTFDRAIDAFLFPGLKSKVIYRNLFVDLRGRANEFFKNFFDVETDSDKRNYFFGMWSEIILRTTDKPAELMKFYHENFEPLERGIDDSTLKVVVKKFFDKVGDVETLPSAYFQSRLAELALIKAGLALVEAAYSKVKKLSLTVDELPFKISVVQVLAKSFSLLERYKDEIPLREEIVRDCERCFPAKDDRISAAKYLLSVALEHGDRQNDAFKIRQQIFESFDESDGENFTGAAKDFANDLEYKGDYKTALSVRKKIVAFYEKDNNEKFYWALSDIIDTLGNLSGAEYLEEKAEFYRKYMTVAKKIGIALSPYEINEFVETLKQLGRDEEAEKILASQADDSARRIEDLERRIESFDAPAEETAELMLKLVELLEESNRSEEAELWREKIMEVTRAVINRYTAEPVEDFDAAISALENYLWNIPCDYDQEILIRRAILSLTEKKPGVEESEIIAAKKGLTDRLFADEENHPEDNQLFEEIENFYRKDLPTTREEFVEALCDHAEFLKNKFYDYSAAHEKLIEALNFLENDSEASADEILEVMDQIADIFDTEENYSEAVTWREKAWNFCRENLLEDDPEALRALDNLIWACEKLEDRDKVEEYRQQLRSIKEKNLGSAHTDVINEKRFLADALRDAGKYVDELKLRRAIVDLYRENFSANAANKYHSGRWIDFISEMKSLAECHDRLGQESEALSIRGQIVDEWQDRIKVLKENYATEDEIVDAQEKLAEAQKKIDALNQDAAPEETSPEEIDTSESLALRKGQRVPLTKDNPALNELIIESRWESDDDLEIDASAFLLGADGKTHADEDFIFYGNPRHNSGAVELDNSAIHIKLKKIPDAIERISFTLTIYDAEARKQNFGRVKVFVRVIDGAACKEIFCFDLRDGFSVETAIVGGEIYRHKGEWKFNAVGAGFSGGLKALCEMFGVEVD